MGLYDYQLPFANMRQSRAIMDSFCRYAVPSYVLSTSLFGAAGHVWAIPLL